MNVVVTRFNNKTWDELVNYRRCNDIEVIYNSPTRLKDSCRYRSKMILLEMNNELNQIMGISIVENKADSSKKHTIYSDKNYNRFSFYGSCRIDVNDLDNEEKEIINSFEQLVFRGKTHIKRGSGITIISNNKISTKHNFRNYKS